MSVDIAILNKHGVALAADSAGTVGSGDNKKVYNNSEKLFMLTKKQPVGIMKYGDSELMGIDWDLIIKEYRKIKGNDSFGTLFEYADHFFDFVKKINFFSLNNEIELLENIADEVFDEVNDNFLAMLKNKFPKEGETQEGQIKNMFNKNIKEFNKKLKDNDNGENRIKPDENFIKSNRAVVNEVIDDVFENYKLTDEQKDSLIPILIQYIKNLSSYDDNTGIVIAGYGNNEVLPSLISFNVYGKLGFCLLYKQDEKCKIALNTIREKNEFPIGIYPFAQDDVASTFLYGIDYNILGVLIQQFNDTIDKLTDVVEEKHKENLEKIKESYSNLLTDVVAELSKSVHAYIQHLTNNELAKMAEELVNMTSFKRHSSIDAYSETVGGPTDVAVITKGDGFIWTKKKNYFDINLNKHYLDNYYGEVQDG